MLIVLAVWVQLVLREGIRGEFGNRGICTCTCRAAVVTIAVGVVDDVVVVVVVVVDFSAYTVDA